jgi:hypothetical protein
MYRVILIWSLNCKLKIMKEIKKEEKIKLAI